MATISYKITGGTPPFTAKIYPSSIPDNIHITQGEYQFTDVPNGGYTLIVTDSNGCSRESELNINPNITTSTTTIQPTDLIVVGNSQDESLIFDTYATNRNMGYSGYPDENIVTLYLWFKTLDGKQLVSNKVVNYAINSSSESKFNFVSLSDEQHVNIVQTAQGLSSTISGQLVFKPGFIETFFEYIYIKDSNEPNFSITLDSSDNCFYDGIPMVDVTNVYGVSFVSTNNIIMEF